MKPNYKNWVPKILIAGMAAATALSMVALIVFGICGLWVTKTWKIILAIVFAVATIGCGKTLQWSITAYRAFSYDGIHLTQQGEEICRERILPLMLAEERSLARMSKEEQILLLQLTEKQLANFEEEIERIVSCKEKESC